MELGIDLGNDTLLACDAAVLREPTTIRGPVPGALVALAIEVAVSTADRDLTLKRRLCAEAGIPAYWVVDAARKVVHVFERPADGDYAGLSLVRFGEPLAVPGASGTVTIG